MDIDLAVKRASLLSDKVYGLTGTTPVKKDVQEKAPVDKYYLAALFSFFTGMAGFIPLTFFITANDYWMYKLRDTAYDTYDLNNKTFLQKMFASMNSIGTSIPSVLSVILTGRFGHKIENRKKFLIALGTVSLLFVIFTSLIEVDTDSWQTLFFVLSLGVIGLIAFVHPFYGMTNLAFLSKFPTFYMKMNMFGTAVGGLFSSTLQTISLSIGNNSTQIALIYFISGTMVIIFTFCLAYLIKYSAVVQFYTRNQEEHKKLTYSKREYWEALKTVWPLTVMTFLSATAIGYSHPNISSLVVSEGYVKDSDNLWYDKYFVVIATFFLCDVCQLIGRFFAKPWITKNNYWWFILIAALRSFLLSPLFMFCNAQPREHLAVWFPHDYQYMIILAVSSLSLSILMTIQYISLPNLAGEKAELGYIIMVAVGIFSMMALTPLNPLYVTLL